MFRRGGTMTVALAVALCLAACVGMAAAGPSSPGFNTDVCSLKGLANCDKRNPDCETNLGTSNRHCGRCGNACPIGTVCVGGTCLRSTCPLITRSGRTCPGINTCKLGACVTGAVQCGTKKSGGGATLISSGTRSYIVNIGTCAGSVAASNEHFKFWYNAFDVPAQFTIKTVTGTVIYGPVVVGSGAQHCANSNKCPGNPFGANCPTAPIPLRPNVPLSGPGVRLTRPAGDTRVVVEVKAPCKDSKWEFRVSCTLSDCIR